MNKELQFKAIGQIPWDNYQYDVRIFNVLGQQILIKNGNVTYFSNVDFEIKIEWSEEELAQIITKESLIGVSRLEAPYAKPDSNSVLSRG